jgi:hypothetical protein
MNVDVAHAWRNADHYAYINALASAGGAWEFLRRNPDYQRAWRAFGRTPCHLPEGQSDAAAWGLLSFESPERDARSANVFWQRNLSREVLPINALSFAPAAQDMKLSLVGLKCRVAVQSGAEGAKHILFAEDGRFLQLEVQGLQAIEGAHLTTEIVLSSRLAAARVQALTRFVDLVTHRRLRPTLYPAQRRASRWAMALRAFDAAQVRASHRQIAAALFGETIVREEWSGRSDYLRLRVQRLLRFAQGLVDGGYRDLLR